MSETTPHIQAGSHRAAQVAADSVTALHNLSPWVMGLAVVAFIGLCFVAYRMLRVLVTTALIGGTQWALLATSTDWRLWAFALGVPAFIAAALFGRMRSATTSIEHGHVKGGKR
ncbi:hypothetical protein AB0M48_07895 [Lentzea sp. NPDC051208]|uniref:hypothetical protein n=1 Tax=Lentzea sp. NPDC051208 TaxID=3154642 RepID=UPI00344ACCA4